MAGPVVLANELTCPGLLSSILPREMPGMTQELETGSVTQGKNL